LTEAIIVDDGIIKKRKIIEKIAEKNDSAVLMINQNLYTHRADFPNAILYNQWREINQQMILFFWREKTMVFTCCSSLKWRRTTETCLIQIMKSSMSNRQSYNEVFHY
jgi:hypothetical protein